MKCKKDGGTCGLGGFCDECTEQGLSDVERVVSCRHTVTQGRKGDKGSWCVECGVKVWEVETRECQDCQHYFKTINYTGCRKHLMAVIPTMNVTYSIEKGSCWKGN